jgi:hypothetical protein
LASVRVLATVIGGRLGKFDLVTSTGIALAPVSGARF